jgi:hypothetical protein
MDKHEFSFRVTDIANGYSLNCTWGPAPIIRQGVGAWTESHCVMDGHADRDVTKNKGMILAELTRDQADNNEIPQTRTLMLSQNWICGAGDEGAYP